MTASCQCKTPNSEFMKTHCVVGSGTAGIAATRSLLKESNVILIDTGDDVVNTECLNNFERIGNLHQMSEMWSYRAYNSRRYYVSEAQAKLNGRSIFYPQGSGINGTSNINAMILTMGSSVVFNTYWHQSWHSNIILPEIKSLCNFIRPATLKSSGLLQHIIKLNDKRCNSSFAPYFDDETPQSSYLAFINQCGTSRLNLKQNLIANETFKGTLTILLGCKVERIIFNGNNAVSLLVNEKGSIRTISPLNNGEIILCAGAFETPNILLSSLNYQKYSPNININNTINNNNNNTMSHVDMFEKTFKDVNMAAIGKNLQDHIVLPMIFYGNWYEYWSIFQQSAAISSHIQYNSDSSNNSNNESNNKSKRPLYPLNGVHGWINLAEDGEFYDYNNNNNLPPSCQLLFVDGHLSAFLLTELLLPRYPSCVWYTNIVRPFLAIITKFIEKTYLVRWLLGYTFAILICVTQPYSRGKVYKDPNIVSKEDLCSNKKPLKIDFGYLTDDSDIKILKNGFHRVKSMIETVKKTKFTIPSDYMEAMSNNKKEKASLLASKTTKFQCIELLPGPLFNYGHTESLFHTFMGQFSVPYYHASGTCAMRTNKVDNIQYRRKDDDNALDCNVISNDNQDAVVDEELRVIGINNLRVADASVIPVIPSGPTSATCLVLGSVVGKLINNKK